MPEMLDAAKQIGEYASAHPRDTSALLNWFAAIELAKNEDKAAAYSQNELFRYYASNALKSDGITPSEGAKIYDALKKSYLLSAKDNFSDFMFYIEWNRAPEKRFYQPRMGYLKPMVDGYQAILDGKLDLLTVSQPKRSGKTSVEINFVNMVSGLFPDKSSLIEGAGDALVNSFYKGCLEYLTDPQYLFYDVFPEARMVQTNADMKTINLASKSRFPTIMCRSIDATQVGLSEATNVLVLDDCVLGREEAMNRALLDKKWECIRGDVLGRRIQGTPIVATGTRYSLYDPIGHLQEEAQKLGWRWKAVEIPALDPVTDESNYDHIRDGKHVFTTEYFRGERELLSDEQWESEFQQQPFEAKGLLFPEDKLQRYFKLPSDREPDAIIAVGDTKEKGADYVMLPVGYVYGADVFIEDVVFDDAGPEHTKPECANALRRNNVARATFESNAAGEYFARDVEALLTKLGGKTSIRTKRTVSNKAVRIETSSDNILKHFWFKDKSTYDPKSQYAAMIKALTTYTRSGKNAHDDAPDGLAMLEIETRWLHSGECKAIDRPW
jgi:predicted phage terminase large subunit-like protein